MDDLLDEFVAESREMLEALGGEIVAWESNPGDRSRLDAIFRFVHTVKGNCGFFDLPRLEALSHAAEDALADVRAGRRHADAALVNAVLAVIDRIGDMVTAIEAGTDFPEGGDTALIAALDPDADSLDADCVPLPLAGDKSISGTTAQRSIRLSVDLLDRVMSGVSDLVLARNDLARCLREVPGQAAIDGPFQRLSSVLAEVRDAMTRTRMQRIESLFALLPRLARDLSVDLGKQVMIDIDGGDVELDREMIEMIRDPLTHIIRNAIDHGIEPPAKRMEAGKREIGLLSVSARQSGNQILIEIVDDGRGINDRKLVEKAIAAGIVTEAEAAQMTPCERYGLICEPGLSTAEAVSAVSGRGVGMDVVRANVERLGGSIELDSTTGIGTRITLRVPLTLTITPALTVAVSGLKFAIPRSYIEEIVRSDGEAIEISRVGEALLAKVRDQRLPLVVLAEVLGLPVTTPVERQTYVVLRLAGCGLFALAIEQLHDHEELVVKPLAPEVMASGIYAGTTLSDDGSPVLLLDVSGVAIAGGLNLDVQDRAARAIEADHRDLRAPGPPVLLFRGFDGRRKAMRMAIVDRIEEVGPEAISAGDDRMRVVLGESILPLAGLEAGCAPESAFKLFRLCDGASEIAYAFSEVIDLASIDADIIVSEVPGEIEGITLIDGEAVSIIDPHWLFAHQSWRPAGQRQSVCSMPLGDPWMTNFLKPIVEGAGYRIVDSADEVAIEIDLAIAPIEDETQVGLPPAMAAHVIRLRAHPDETPGSPETIYRYDREGLLMALSAASEGRLASGGNGR